jgi:hypothetical protein
LQKITVSFLKIFVVSERLRLVLLRLYGLAYKVKIHYKTVKMKKMKNSKILRIMLLVSILTLLISHRVYSFSNHRVSQQLYEWVDFDDVFSFYKDLISHTGVFHTEHIKKDVFMLIEISITEIGELQNIQLKSNDSIPKQHEYELFLLEKLTSSLKGKTSLFGKTIVIPMSWVQLGGKTFKELYPRIDELIENLHKPDDNKELLPLLNCVYSE